MQYAIFEDSGTQIKAEVGQELVLDIRELDDNAKSVTFDRVLMVGSEKDPKIGTPYVDGASVTADILERQFKGEKIDVIKFKRRKGYRVKTGHRQRYLRVRIKDIAS